MIEDKIMKSIFLENLWLVKTNKIVHNYSFLRKLINFGQHRYKLNELNKGWYRVLCTPKYRLFLFERRKDYGRKAIIFAEEW